MTKTLFIRMTGPRCDARPRSASPTRRKDEAIREREQGDLPFSQLPLPSKATVYVRPTIDKSGRAKFSPKVLEPNLSWDVIRRRAEVETGRVPEIIGEVDMSSRVKEKDVSSQCS